jgi:enterochelin esterase-like enzyme
MHSLIAAVVLALTTSPPGETRVVRIPSKILGEERVVHVSLPLNYGVARRRYETTYLLDGHVRQFFDITVAAAGYDVVADLQHDYATPPQIVVGVDQIDRGADLGRNQELFTRFLVEELIPYIDREFRTNRYRTLIGHSLGGRFALMTFCRAPGVFPAVIAISAAGGDSTSADAVTRCLSTAFNAPGTALRQLVLSAGDQEPRVIQGMERLRDFLRANAPPHWRWTTIEGAGLGHTDTPMATIPPGIRFIHDKSVWEMPRGLADSVQFGRVADPERAVDAFYSNLSARVGVPMTPSLKWMLAPTRVLIQRGDSAGAERAIRQLIAAYPEDLEAYGMASDLALRRGDKAASRQALNDALRMLGRLDFYDVYERERKRKLIENALLSVGR